MITHQELTLRHLYSQMQILQEENEALRINNETIQEEKRLLEATVNMLQMTLSESRESILEGARIEAEEFGRQQ